MKCWDRFKKSVALGLVVTFVMTQNTPMTMAQVIQALVNTSDRPFLLQQIPSEFGRIQETFAGTNGKSVILIQDAHGSLPVQKNIRSLISFLNQTYGINLLMLEGAAQKLEPDLYRFYEEAEPSRLVGERLLERGELTGAEMFLLDQAIDRTCKKNQCAEGQGVENPEMYARDLTLFREIISRDHELAERLSLISLLFQKKASRILSPKLLQFLKAVDQAETTEAALPETLQKINVQAKETLQLDFLNPKNQFAYPMLVRYFKLREMEGKIQVEAAEAESQRLVKWLEANKAPQNLIKQIRELSPQTTQMRAVLEELVRVMQSKGFDFKDYPQWTQWAGMNALMQEVEPTALMKEMEQVIWKIVSKLAPKPEQKSILTLYRKTFYLRKLLTLSLTSEEWQKIELRRSELTPSRLWNELDGAKLYPNLGTVIPHTSRLAYARSKNIKQTIRIAQSYGSSVVENRQTQIATPSFPQKDGSAFGGETRDDDRVASEPSLNSNLDKAFSKALEFYKTAKQREIHFVDNLQKQMQSKKQNRAVLVAGGFHQAGVLQKLKNAGFGYVSVMPNAGGFDLKESKKTYRRAMLETSQVAQLLRMGVLGDSRLAALADLENRRAEIRLAKDGILGSARPGTALGDDLNQSRTLGVRGGDVMALARSETRSPYISPNNFKEGVERFYAYKLEMLNALSKEKPEELLEDAEEFRGALEDFYKLVDFLGVKVAEEKDRDALVKIALDHGNYLSETGQYPMQLFGHQNADGVLREIETLSVGDGDEEFRKLRATIIEGMATELYPESKADQDGIKGQLNNDILTTSVRNMLPHEAFPVDKMNDWKEAASAELLGLSGIINSWGHYSLVYKNIKVNPNPQSMTSKGAQSKKDRELILRSTIKHEAIHYLSDDIPGRGRILKIPAEWEFLTYALDVMERVQHMPEGAKLDDYKDEFGDQALEALFERGRQYARDGGAGIEIKDGVAGGVGAGVFFDGLYAEAVLAYKDAELSSTAFLNRYAGQRAVAIVLGGFLHEKNIADSNFGTLAYLKSVFDVLDARQGAPSSEEKPHIEKVFAELQSYVSSLAGEHVELRPVSGGFWRYQNGTDGGAGQLQYLPSDFRPRIEDGELLVRVAAMRERVLGHALLALGKTNHARTPSIGVIAVEVTKHPAFGIAWDIFNIPHVIQMALTQLGFKQGLSETIKKGAVLWIYRVFQDRYSPQIPLAFSKAKLASLPLHLQYLDSLIYMFVNVKKENINGRDVFVAEDPRLENKEALAALKESFGDFEVGTDNGWGAGKLILDASKINLEKFTQIFARKVWPAYERLYNLALEQEMRKLEAANKVKDDAKEAMQQQYQQMAQNYLQQSQNQFQGQMQSGQQSQDSAGQVNSSGQSGQPGQSGNQPGGQGGAEGMMQALQGGSQSGSESGSAAGQGQSLSPQAQSGDKNPFKPFQNPSASSDAGQPPGNPLQSGGDAATQQGSPDSKGMQQMLTGLEQQLNGLSEKVQGLQSQLGQMGQNLSQMQSQASGLGAKAGDSGASEPQSGLAEALQSGASALDEGTQSLQQDAGGVLQGAKSAVSQAKQAAAQQSWSSDALQAQSQSEQSVKEAQQLKDQAAKLQAMAQKIKKQIDQITKDLAATASPDVSTLSAQAAAVQKNIQDFKNQAAKMQGTAQSMDSTLEGLQSSVQGLQQAMKNLEGKEGQEGPGTEDQGPTTSSGESGSPQSPGQSSPSSSSEQSASSEGGSGARFDLPSQAAGLSGLTGIGAATESVAKKASPKLKPFKPQGVSIEMDEKADAAKWGFTVDQWREYLSWKKEMVTVARGRNVQVSRLIDETKEFLDALLIPVRKTKEVGPYVEGEELGDDHLVDAAMGQPAMVDEVKKLPVLMSISIIFDRSGSMGWGEPGSEPIKLAKLIGFVLLEALFEHNEERETRGYRDQPLRFELGLFENDPTLLVSHETTQNTDSAKRSSKKIIYDLIKKLEAGGGTSFSKALGAFVTQAKQDDDPNYTSSKAIRMMFAVTDVQVSEFDKSGVLGLIEEAKKDNVSIFVVPVGSAEDREDSLIELGEENVILAKPLSLLPQAIGAEMVTAVAERYPSIPISEDVQSFARSEARGPLEKIETGTFDENGDKRHWNYFYTQKRDGRDYLVWYDAENPDQTLAWESGPGGPQVPRMKIPPTKSNELFIKELYKSLYRANSHFSSVSSDGKWLIRETGSGELELDQFDANVGRTMELMRSNRESLARIQVSENVYSNGTVWWKKSDVGGGVKISFDGKHFDDLDGIEIDADNITELEIQKATDQKIAVFDHRGGRIYLADKSKSDWKLTERLQLESQDLSNRWYRRLIEVTGETGLAKDVLILAAAQLMNEQVFFIPINENLKEGELDWRRVLGLEGEGTTSDLPSALALAQEHGGWVLLREAHKMPEELWPLLKVKISDNSHKSLIGDTPVIRPDHPRFRMLASSNLARRNIQGSANRDQAVQRRKEAILKTWEWPQDEVMLQLEFARTFAIEQGTFYAGFDQEMGPVIERLVNTAVAQRLTFLGYSNRQQQELTKNRRSWDKLKDWDYAPDNKAGEMLKRAPSPRVIRNVVAHFVKYPKDLEHRPWSVIHGYYNFDAEVDRDKTYTRVETDFEKVGFQDRQKNETPVLKPESFKVLKNKDGSFSLEITPIETGAPRWEKVVIPLHKDSELAKNPKALPKKLMGWLDLPENALTIYQMMQDYSLGKDTMLVGEQETGKSVLIEESQALVGKKPIQKIGITQHTKSKDITYQMDMKGGKTRFAKKPVAVAAEEGLPVHLEEANQAESLAVLNDLLDSRMLIDPLGNRVQIARGFVAWLSINPPGQGFLVNTFSDEFLERVAIRKVHPLPSAQVRAYLEQAIYKNGKSVNSRFVGEEKRGGAAGEWTGLIGLAQKIRELRDADPQFLPRAPGPGTLESMVSDILDHYETNLADRNIHLKEELASEKVNVPKVSASEIIRLYFAGAYDKDAKLKNAIAKHMVRPQEVVRDMLLRKFTMQGKGPSQNAQWVTNFTEAMKKVGLWADTATKPGEDGVLNFLAGEELVAESYPVLREPKTGDVEMDTLLRYLQMYPKSAAFIGKADDLTQRIEALSKMNDSKGKMIEWPELLQRFSKLAEIHGIFANVYKVRQKEMAAGNVQMAANGVKLKELSGMIQTLVNDRNWPTYVLTQAEDPAFDVSAELTKWLARYKDAKDMVDKVTPETAQDATMRLHVFAPDPESDEQIIYGGRVVVELNSRSEMRFKMDVGSRSEMRSSTEIREKIKLKDKEIEDFRVKIQEKEANIAAWQSIAHFMQKNINEALAVIQELNQKIIEDESEINELKIELEAALAKETRPSWRIKKNPVKPKIKDIGPRVPSTSEPYRLKIVARKAGDNNIPLHGVPDTRNSTFIYKYIRRYVGPAVRFAEVNAVGGEGDFADFVDFEGNVNLNYDEIVSAKQPVGSNVIYIVVKDSVDSTSLRGESYYGNYQFTWINQRDAESAAGYAQYKGILDYEEGSVLDLVLPGFSTLPGRYVVQPDSMGMDRSTHNKAFDSSSQDDRLHVNFTEDNPPNSSTSTLGGDWSISVDYYRVPEGTRQTFLAQYSKANGFKVEGYLIQLTQQDGTELEILKRVKWDNENQQLVFVLPAIIEKKLRKLIQLSQSTDGGIGWRIEFDESLNPQGINPSKVSVSISRSEIRSSVEIREKIKLKDKEIEDFRVKIQDQEANIAAWMSIKHLLQKNINEANAVIQELNQKIIEGEKEIDELKIELEAVLTEEAGAGGAGKYRLELEALRVDIENKQRELEGLRGQLAGSASAGQGVGERYKEYEIDGIPGILKAVTLKGEDFLIIHHDGKFQIKGFDGKDWVLKAEELAAENVVVTKVGDQILIELLAGTQKQIWAFDGLGLKKIDDFPRKTNFSWKVIGNEAVVFVEYPQWWDFMFWDGEKLNTIRNTKDDDQKYSPRRPDWDWKWVAEKVMVRFDTLDGTKLYQWNPEDGEVESFPFREHVNIQSEWVMAGDNILLISTKLDDQNNPTGNIEFKMIDGKTGKVLGERELKNSLTPSFVTQGEQVVIQAKKMGIDEYSYVIWNGQMFYESGLPEEYSQVSSHMLAGKKFFWTQKKGGTAILFQWDSIGSHSISFAAEYINNVKQSQAISMVDQLVISLLEDDGTYQLIASKDILNSWDPYRQLKKEAKLTLPNVDSATVVSSDDSHVLVHIKLTNGKSQFLIWDGENVHQSEVYSEVVPVKPVTVDGKMLISFIQTKDKTQLIIWDEKTKGFGLQPVDWDGPISLFQLGKHAFLTSGVLGVKTSLKVWKGDTVGFETISEIGILSAGKSPIPVDGGHLIPQTNHVVNGHMIKENLVVTVNGIVVPNPRDPDNWSVYFLKTDATAMATATASPEQIAALESEIAALQKRALMYEDLIAVETRIVELKGTPSTPEVAPVPSGNNAREASLSDSSAKTLFDFESFFQALGAPWSTYPTDVNIKTYKNAFAERGKNNSVGHWLIKLNNTTFMVQVTDGGKQLLIKGDKLSPGRNNGSVLIEVRWEDDRDQLVFVFDKKKEREITAAFSDMSIRGDDQSVGYRIEFVTPTIPAVAASPTESINFDGDLGGGDVVVLKGERYLIRHGQVTTQGAASVKKIQTMDWDKSSKEWKNPGVNLPAKEASWEMIGDRLFIKIKSPFDDRVQVILFKGGDVVEWINERPARSSKTLDPNIKDISWKAIGDQAVIQTIDAAGVSSFKFWDGQGMTKISLPRKAHKVDDWDWKMIAGKVVLKLELKGHGMELYQWSKDGGLVNWNKGGLKSDDKVGVSQWAVVGDKIFVGFGMMTQNNAPTGPLKFKMIDGKTGKVLAEEQTDNSKVPFFVTQEGDQVVIQVREAGGQDFFVIWDGQEFIMVNSPHVFEQASSLIIGGEIFVWGQLAQNETVELFVWNAEKRLFDLAASPIHDVKQSQVISMGKDQFLTSLLQKKGTYQLMQKMDQAAGSSDGFVYSLKAKQTVLGVKDAKVVSNDDSHVLVHLELKNGKSQFLVWDGSTADLSEEYEFVQIYPSRGHVFVQKKDGNGNWTVEVWNGKKFETLAIGHGALLVNHMFNPNEGYNLIKFDGTDRTIKVIVRDEKVLIEDSLKPSEKKIIFFGSLPLDSKKHDSLTLPAVKPNALDLNSELESLNKRKKMLLLWFALTEKEGRTKDVALGGPVDSTQVKPAPVVSGVERVPPVIAPESRLKDVSLPERLVIADATIENTEVISISGKQFLKIQRADALEIKTWNGSQWIPKIFPDVKSSRWIAAGDKVLIWTEKASDGLAQLIVLDGEGWKPLPDKFSKGDKLLKWMDVGNQVVIDLELESGGRKLIFWDGVGPNLKEVLLLSESSEVDWRFSGNKLLVKVEEPESKLVQFIVFGGKEIEKPEPFVGNKSVWIASGEAGLSVAAIEMKDVGTRFVAWDGKDFQISQFYDLGEYGAEAKVKGTFNRFVVEFKNSNSNTENVMWDSKNFHKLGQLYAKKNRRITF